MDLRQANLQPYVDYVISNIMKIKGKYGFRVTLIYADESQKVCQHAGFEKKGEANEARNNVIAQLHNGVYVVYTNVKVKELLDYWLEEVMKPSPTFTANSYYNYRDCIQKHIVPQIGGLKLLTLNQGHLMKLYKELVKNYSAIPKRAKTIMNTSMRFALSKRLIMTNPCEGVDLPKGVKKNKYHTIEVNETKTYTLEQVKMLLEASKDTRIHMQIVFALLMGLRRGEINGLKYSDIDYKNHKLRIQRQLGRDIHADEKSLKPKTKTKQEIKLKTPSSYRELDIPDYVFEEILEERKKYEKNRSRRQHGQWVFQDLDYICCSSYGRPRSKDYHFVHYKKLLEDVGLPHIRFHDLRHTYATLLMKNDINQKAVAAALGHSKSIITVDTYTDTQAIIEDCVEELQSFITEVHPYDQMDAEMLRSMFQEIISVDEDENAEVEETLEQESETKDIPVIVVYDYSDVTEMDDIAEWYLGEGIA